MTIRFYSENLVEQATIVASNPNALFPATNLQDSRRTKVCRSTTNSSNIVFDFQETSEVDSIILVDSPFDGFGVSTLTAQFNGTDSWGSPAATDVLTFSATHGVGINELATLRNYRFMRLVMTSTLGYCEPPKLFVGKKIALLGERSINYGWTYQSKDTSRVTENRYGQRFADTVSRQRQFNISFSNLDKDQLDQIFELYDDKGVTKPFFVRIGCDSMINNRDRFAGMVFMSSIPVITNRFFNNYSLSMVLEEGM